LSRDGEEITYKEDFPVWKKKGDAIRIEITFSVDSQTDAGLHTFIARIANLNEPPESLEVSVSASRLPDAKATSMTVKVGGVALDEFSSTEIMKKVQTSTAIFFYNSTEDMGFTYRYRRGYGGTLGDFSSDDKGEFEKVQKKLGAVLASHSKKHQKEVSALLGKLEEKYTVGITLPKMNLEHMPIEISLGGKAFSVPLNEWGSGTRNRTQILLTMLKAKKAAESASLSDRITPVIIIEEPESFLHPSAQAEFGRILQDLAREIQVQVITTTHSPYMLSIEQPESNVLLRRQVEGKDAKRTEIVETSGENWMGPFATALGIDNQEFAPWKQVLISQSNNVLLVEGEIDKAYFDYLRQPIHGSRALQFEGEVVAYGGKDTLKNCTLLKFILGRHERTFVTFDLDARMDVERHLKMLSLEERKDYLPLGINSPGKRDIEGLLPPEIVKVVYAANVELVQAVGSAITDERKSAKSKLKHLLLEEFQKSAIPGSEALGPLYAAAAIVQKSLTH
jgi:hypothetical protein